MKADSKYYLAACEMEAIGLASGGKIPTAASLPHRILILGIYPLMVD